MGKANRDRAKIRDTLIREVQRRSPLDRMNPYTSLSQRRRFD